MAESVPAAVAVGVDDAACCVVDVAESVADVLNDDAVFCVVDVA